MSPLHSELNSSNQLVIRSISCRMGSSSFASSSSRDCSRRSCSSSRITSCGRSHSPGGDMTDDRRSAEENGSRCGVTGRRQSGRLTILSHLSVCLSVCFSAQPVVAAVVSADLTTSPTSSTMENLGKKPKKGILKSSSSFEQPEPAAKPAEIKFDEMNILQTLHPADKDYGFMKIDEPKTPYSYTEGSEEDAATAGAPIEHRLDPETVAQKIRSRERRLSIDDAAGTSGDHEEADEENLTEEEKLRRKEFESKRKSHYNEFQAVKLARQLLEEDDDDDGGDAGEGEANFDQDAPSSSVAPAAENGVTSQTDDTI